jgi:hypothetical protein
VGKRGHAGVAALVAPSCEGLRRRGPRKPSQMAGEAVSVKVYAGGDRVNLHKWVAPA